MHKIQHAINKIVLPIVFCLAFLLADGLKAQTITDSSPQNTSIGNSAMITGSGFFETTEVVSEKIGILNVYNSIPEQNNLINRIVSTDLSIGVVNTNKSSVSVAGFAVVPTPTIVSLTPSSAAAGTTVTIKGTNFSGTGVTVSSVQFGGVNASSYTVLNGLYINAIVPSGASSGNVTVTTSGGTASISGFVFLPSPTISSFSPNSAASGTTITITGTNFTGTGGNVNSLKFGGTSASSFTIVNSTTITAVVASGTTGSVSVTTSAAAASLAGFTFIPSPTITTFTPRSAGIDSVVTISGTNFTGVGVTVNSVSFGGTAASSFNVVNSTTITAVVASGTSGNVTITTTGGTASIAGFTFIPTPTGVSITPSSASTGTTVTIKGTNFSGIGVTVNSVQFGGVEASSFTVLNGIYITAVVPTGATSGNVTVITSGGTASIGGFVYLPTPTVGSFSPTSAASGATITISGTNFTGSGVSVSALKFGGTAASSFTVVNSTTITAVVASGTTGSLSVTTTAGTANLAGFTFIPSPTISSFTPNTTALSGTVTITGTNFTGVGVTVNSVSFGGTTASSFNIVNSTTITAVVSSGATGNVTVTTTGGTASLAGFSFIPTPTIVSITPTSASTGTTVSIKGTNFSGTGITVSSVQFGGVAASSYTVLNGIYINAVVPNGATSGNVTVTTSGGTASLGSFVYIPTPTISSFSPTEAASGATVTITGTNFTGTGVSVSTLKFGGTAASSFTVINSTTITAVVASGTSGSVLVTTSGGTASLNGFSYIPAPTVSSFSPTTAATGATITITGTNFTGTGVGVNSLKFGGTSASSFNVINSTTITAVVASGTSGSLSVTSSGGTASLAGFTYIPTPTVTSFSPITAATGTQITITGANFSGSNLGTSSVTIGGVAVSTLTINSATQITATVPVNAASGNVMVTNNGGAATLGGFTYISSPTITSFSPTTVGKDSIVTIFGTGYFGTGVTVTSVKFGGTNASSFTVVNNTTITAVVATGTSGFITIITTGGTAASASSFTFVAAPIVTLVSSSPALTGNLITLTGTNLSDASSVKFGGVSSTFTKISSTTITATVPTGVRGTVPLVVSTPGGTTSGNTITINNSWSGATSSNWSTGTNWNTGLVPTIEDVIIPIGLTTYPVLSTDITVGNIVLNGTVALNSHKLTISNSLTGAGTLISSAASSLDMQGSGTINFDVNNNSINNLTINNSVTLGNNLNLYGILYPTSGTFTTGGHLTLKSISSNQGIVATVGGTISGTVTVERFIPKNTSFRPFIDLCPIVANAGSIFTNWQERGVNSNTYGVQITGISGPWDMVDAVKGFDVSQKGSGSLQTNTGTWAYATNTKTMNLDPSQGYRLLVRGNRSYSLFTTPQPKYMNSDVTLRTTGNLITGTVYFQTSGTTSTGGFSSSHGLNSGSGVFNFIANPFASPVSWTSVLSHSTGINPEYYYLDPTFADGSGNQSYVTYNATTGVNNNSNSSVGDIIQPGQAIFVKNSGGTNPVIVFQESDKRTSTSIAIFGTHTPVNKLSLNLYKNNKSIDGAVAVFKSCFSKKLGAEDSKKLMNAGENLTFSEDGKQLCIEGLDLPNIKDTINIQLSKMIVNTNYQIKLNTQQFDANGLNAYLLDKYTNAKTLLATDETIISFITNTDSKSYSNRFCIIFSSVLSTEVLPKESITLITSVKSSSSVELNWFADNAANLASFTIQRSINGIDFTSIKSISAFAGNYSFIDENASRCMNYYRIKKIGKDGTITFSKIAKQLLGKENNSITIYPNPVINKNFTVQLKSLIGGNYTLKLYDALGRIVLTKYGVHSIGTFSETVNIGSLKSLKAGVYVVEITDSDGQSFQNQVTIN